MKLPRLSRPALTGVFAVVALSAPVAAQDAASSDIHKDRTASTAIWQDVDGIRVPGTYMFKVRWPSGTVSGRVHDNNGTSLWKGKPTNTITIGFPIRTSGTVMLKRVTPSSESKTYKPGDLEIAPWRAPGQRNLRATYTNLGPITLRKGATSASGVFVTVPGESGTLLAPGTKIEQVGIPNLLDTAFVTSKFKPLKEPMKVTLTAHAEDAHGGEIAASSLTVEVRP